MKFLQLTRACQNDITRLADPHPSDCYKSWKETDLDETLMNVDKPRYSKPVCNRFCLQHEVMKACDCFHTQLDISLMNITKFPYVDRQRPCDTDRASEGGIFASKNKVPGNWAALTGVTLSILSQTTTTTA